MIAAGPAVTAGSYAEPVSGRVVVVEDDASIGRSLEAALTGHGYTVRWCSDIATATDEVEATAPDLVLLDANLPDGDGFSFCRWLRSLHPDLPIVLVTARDTEIDAVVGLDAGANDYVTKPFSTNVLLARVRAHLRRRNVVDPAAPIALGALVVDPGAYIASVGGAVVDLRRRELELLVALAREAGRVVTRERLMSEVWDSHWESSSKTLDMHISALRRKLGPAVDITTVRGVGYRLAPS